MQTIPRKINPSMRPSHLIVFLLTLILAHGARGVPLEDWIVVYTGSPTNTGTGRSYLVVREIDLNSIERSGTHLRYRARTIGGLLAAVSTEEIASDCIENRRGQWTDLRFYNVYEGTLSGDELRAACQAAESRGVLSATEAGPHSQTKVAAIATRPTTQSTIAPLPFKREPSSTSFGSGFAVSGKLVVTNRHVVQRCATLSVSQDGQALSAILIASSETTDLALLHVAGASLRVPPLRINAALGEDVVAAGYPLSGILSSDIVITFGQVNSLAGLGNDPTHVQISAPIQPGNSGGPLIDRSGAIVGVIVSKINVLRLARITGDVAQNINFAIKPEILRLFLDSNRISYRSVQAAERLDGVELANRARTFTVKIQCVQG